ncbi:MAG: YfaZ family outer membrane protein [Pseudomonadota bacterium]
MLLRHIAVFTLLTTSLAAEANSFDIDLGNHNAQLSYNVPMERTTEGRPEMHFALDYNDNNSVLGEIGVMVVNETENTSGLSIGVGVKGVLASIDRNGASRSNDSAVALGAQLRFSPPDAKRFGVVAQFHYAPRIISFGDADNYSQSLLRVEYEVMPSTLAYVGYRKTKFGSKNSGPDAVMDNGMHVGVRIAF